MTRLIEESIEVRSDSRDLPCFFRWRRRSFRVARILEQWKDVGTWWSGEEEKHFFRIQLETGGLAEIFRKKTGREWILYRLWD